MNLLKLIFAGLFLFQSLYAQKPLENDVSVKACKRYLHIAQKNADIKAFDQFLFCFSSQNNQDRALINSEKVMRELSVYFHKVFRLKPQERILKQYYQTCVNFMDNVELLENLAEEFSDYAYKNTQVVFLLIAKFPEAAQKQLLRDALFVERKDKKIENEIAKYPALAKIFTGQ